MVILGVKNEKGLTYKERISGYIDFIREHGTIAEINLALSEDWEPAQLYELSEGIKSGIDISVYAKPEYNEFKMGYIRLAMERGLDFKRLLNPDFDEFDIRNAYKEIEVG